LRPATDAPRLLVVDVDGTLLDSHKRVTDAAAAAIARLRAGGVDVVLATGRLPAGIAATCRRLNLSGPQVCAHGAVVADPLTGEVVASRPLSPAEVTEHLQFAHDLEVDAIVADAGGFRVTELRPDFERLFVPFDEPLPRLVDETELLAGSPVKTYLDTGSERYRAVLEAAEERLGDRFTITSPDGHSVELLAHGVTKLSGLRAAAAARGIDASEFVAVGDGPNDVPLLQVAQISVAMGQAPAEVRAAATFVTESNDQEGLAQALAAIYGFDPPHPAHHLPSGWWRLPVRVLGAIWSVAVWLVVAAGLAAVVLLGATLATLGFMSR
jgi:Cof subfamily protein (haloacid dehalogenase superfamily)